MTNHLIVNFFGGPGVGKTTASAELFISLKKNNVDAHLVGEFAQECVLEGNVDSLNDQLYIFGNTYHRLRSAYQQATVTVIDSPILLSCIYQEGLPDLFNQLVLAMHERFRNLNVLLERTDGYNHSMMGRVHSLSESVGIDKQIERMLEQYEVPFVRQNEIDGNLTEYLTQQILEFLNGTEVSE